jgi:peptidoglycan/LPS O-acetylase OafA/YrhL
MMVVMAIVVVMVMMMMMVMAMVMAAMVVMVISAALLPLHVFLVDDDGVGHPLLHLLWQLLGDLCGVIRHGHRWKWRGSITKTLKIIKS